MHETSLVQSLLSQVAAVVADHADCRVETIRVEIGPLSGVEPLLIQSAFERLQVESSCREAELVIESVPLTCRCRDCEAEFELAGFRFQCPECGSSTVQVLRGDEFRLIDVTIADDSFTPMGVAGEQR